MQLGNGTIVIFVGVINLFMKLLKLIPNTLTLLNLFCGCIALFYAFEKQIITAAVFVFFGVFFDFFDGFAARLLKVQSELGKQLDSLADMVTSGVVPGVVMCQLLSNSTGQKSFEIASILQGFNWISILGFAITLASAYRLANFNIDENQKEGFIGLPTPANTVLVLSIALIAVYSPIKIVQEILDNPFVLIGFTALSCYLLNAKIVLFGLKFKTFGFEENKHKYLFLIIAATLLLTLSYVGIPFLILTYFLMSWLKQKKKLS